LTYLQHVLRLILTIELPTTGADETCNTNSAEIKQTIQWLINNGIERRSVLRQDSKTVALCARPSLDKIPRVEDEGSDTTLELQRTEGPPFTETKIGPMERARRNYSVQILPCAEYSPSLSTVLPRYRASFYVPRNPFHHGHELRSETRLSKNLWTRSNWQGTKFFWCTTLWKTFIREDGSSSARSPNFDKILFVK